MQRRERRPQSLLSAAAFALLYLVCMPAWPADDTTTTATQLRETVERLNALDEWFSEAEKKRTAWLLELRKQDQAISTINQAVKQIVDSLAEIGVELTTLSEQRQTLTEQRQQQAEHIAQHVGAAYRLTGQDFLKQLLNQESPDELDRMVRYHRFFSESRLNVLAEYQQTLTQIQATDEALTAQQAEQQNQQEQLQAEQTVLAGERNERAVLIASLDAEKESKSAEYDRLKQDRQRLESLLAELRRRATELDGTAFARAKGKLPMPIAGPIKHAFGARRADGRLRWHGIDIAADHGTPVTAVFRGRVIFADWLRGFGFLTILDHGSDYMTLYGHVDVLHKKVGDWVEAGETIAAAGNSGGNQDPGLYFEVRHKGDPKDPITWVNR